MQTMSSGEMVNRPARLRSAVEISGQVVTLTFRERIFGHVVPDALWRRALAALEREEAAQQEVAA